MHRPSGAFLRSVEFFSELQPAELVQVFDRLQRVVVEEGEQLFAQGDPAGGAFLVEDGRLGIFVRTEGHKETAVAELGPNQVIGELALVDGGARSATVRAAERSVLWAFPRDQFSAMRSAGDPVAFKILHSIARTASRRLRATNHDIAVRLDPTLARPAEPSSGSWWSRLLPGRES